PVQAVTPSGVSFAAYEIHMGETTRPAGVTPFATLRDGSTEGVRMGAHTGTYLHGALECAGVLSELLGRTIAEPSPKQRNYDLLPEWFDRHQRGFEELYL